VLIAIETPICSMYSIFTYMTGSFIGYMFANIPAPWSTLGYVLIAIETGFPANYP